MGEEEVGEEATVEEDPMEEEVLSTEVDLKHVEEAIVDSIVIMRVEVAEEEGEGGKVKERQNKRKDIVFFIKCLTMCYSPLEERSNLTTTNWWWLTATWSIDECPSYTSNVR